VKNPLFAWQSLQPTSGPGAAFYQFCDALEVKNGVSAPAKGWGLAHAVQAWGALFKDTYLPSSELLWIRLFMNEANPMVDQSVETIRTSECGLHVDDARELMRCSDCLGTYDANQSYYTDISIGNANRAWFWMVYAHHPLLLGSSR
jgi:hypothetical protein